MSQMHDMGNFNVTPCAHAKSSLPTHPLLLLLNLSKILSPNSTPITHAPKDTSCLV